MILDDSLLSSSNIAFELESIRAKAEEERKMNAHKILMERAAVIVQRLKTAAEEGKSYILWGGDWDKDLSAFLVKKGLSVAENWQGTAHKIFWMEGCNLAQNKR